MVANTFLTVIPGWINTDDPVSDQEAGSFSVSPSPNTSSDVHYDIEVDQSVDINLTQNNPMWRILSEVGIDAESDLHDTEEEYSIISRLGSSCVANLFQLVIIDGPKRITDVQYWTAKGRYKDALKPRSI
ncbi:hypothetical protein OUZ56_024051 [Daphnia magna]|uniref:Uncharacterized protein n=1 Tax=Daphnia magna TaxID=35525 RepID=A0ABR0AZZ5_9CRUS|nr:hypothetical protein OUZ56_024051 [Daphnia magna]